MNFTFVWNNIGTSNSYENFPKDEPRSERTSCSCPHWLRHRFPNVLRALLKILYFLLSSPVGVVCSKQTSDTCPRCLRHLVAGLMCTCWKKLLDPPFKAREWNLLKQTTFRTKFPHVSPLPPAPYSWHAAHAQQKHSVPRCTAREQACKHALQNLLVLLTFVRCALYYKQTSVGTKLHYSIYLANY